MDEDPHNWTVGQVCGFFRDDAQVYLNNIPNISPPILPPMLPFLKVLEENDVSGFVLLTALNTSDLRDDFGVKSFGQRSAVLRCIQELQERSACYSGKRETKKEPLSSTLDAQPALDAPSSTLAATLALDHPSSSSTLVAHPASSVSKRAGEVQVQDELGRKRRKLDLSNNATAAPKVLPRVSKGGRMYLGDACMPVDALFFGKTQLGKEIQHPEPAEFTIFATDRASDSGEHNFQFHGLRRPAGESQYVYRQTHRFLQQDPIDLTRREQPALAILPYREELSRSNNRVQSAMVVQFPGEGDTAVAMRENVAYLSNGGDYNGIAQESTIGQFDYLNDKYGGGPEDTSDTESISSAAFEELQAQITADWQEEQAELAASQGKKPSKDEIDRIVDKTVDGFIQHWNTSRRPVKEASQAWTVWKKMKRSRTLQRHLIEDAEAQINSLNSRLSAQKKYVVMADCWSEAEVITTCGALKITVTDREELKWKIEVWKRKQEPEHVVRHGNQTGAKTATSMGANQPSFVPLEGDRLSLEAGPIPVLEENEDSFVSAPTSPTPQQDHAEDEDCDASDEASRLGDFVEDEEEDEEEPPIDDASRSPQDNDEMSPSTPPSTHDERDRRVHRALTPLSDSDDGLGPMNQFFSQKPKSTPKNKRVFHKPSEPASASRVNTSTVIEISSDSTSTPKSSGIKGKRGQARNECSQNSAVQERPEKSSFYDVEAWDLQDLLSGTDRKRVIIKLLRAEGDAMVFAITALWKELSLTGFKKEILKVMRILQSDPSSLQSDPKSRDLPSKPLALLQSARLALVWNYLDPKIMNGKYPKSIDWNAVEKQTHHFMDFFSLIMNNSNHLFVQPSASSSPAPKKASLPDHIELLDSDSSVEAPPSKRKKRVKYSAKAAESQFVALERQAKFKAAETRSSNSQQLQAMTGSNSGNIAINHVGIEEGKAPIFIHPEIASKMKEHQLSGVRFMWREITAGADTDEDGQGCVLAHAMGLGKTMQAITLLVVANETAHSRNPEVSSQLPKSLRPVASEDYERSLRVLVLCPPTLLDNWRREIEQWARGSLGSIFTADSGKNQMDNLNEWYRYGGVLLMSYHLFSKRINRGKAEEKAGQANKHGPELDKILLQGPEILVADEAHTVKNLRAGVSIAVGQIETKIRIALTGTPMSNDVGEMYALISFAADGFLGGPVEFKAKFAEPIEQGTYADSTSYEQRRSKVKLATLIKLIEPKINRADITALKGSLQPKVEFVVTLPLTDLQRAVYNKYLDALVGEGKNDKASQVAIFSWLSVLTYLTNHPLAFKRKLHEARKPPRQRKAGNSAAADSGSVSPIARDYDNAEGPNYEEEGLRTLGFTEETVKHITADISDSADPSLSAKMDILMKILLLSKQCGDKVLVFSSSIATLDYVGELLTTYSTRFGRICGSVPPPKRPQIIKDFSNGLTEVLIISTQAGGVGLNIQAANRVVILDFGFNPSHEEQAIGRAYRFGQTKPVFVYRLITGGTFEDNIYNKQLFKTSLTQRVVDKKNPRRNAARGTRQYLYPPGHVPQQDLEEWLGKDPSVFDQILKAQLPYAPGDEGMIRKLTTIETLQREGDDPPLNAEELRQAEEEYQTSIAASLGPRGQIPVMGDVPAFVAAQSRVPLARPTQQASTKPRLMVNLTPTQHRPSAAAREESARTPTDVARPSQKIRLVHTTPRIVTPHGLPNPPSPQPGPSGA